MWAQGAALAGGVGRRFSKVGAGGKGPGGGGSGGRAQRRCQVPSSPWIWQAMMQFYSIWLSGVEASASG